MNISCHNKKLRPIVDRPALEPRLKQTPDALVFFVIPVHKTRNYALKNPWQRYFAGFDEEMNVVRHQAVGNEPVTANRLIFPKN